MKNQSTVSSKGQVTIPIEVRRRMGLRSGDAVEFCSERGRTVLKPRKREVRSFSDCIGLFGQGEPGELSAVDWVRTLRDDSGRGQ